jgi:hypothetical protein
MIAILKESAKRRDEIAPDGNDLTYKGFGRSVVYPSAPQT